MVDTLVIQIITGVSMTVGAVLAVIQLRTSWNKRQVESEERIKNWISESDKTILGNFKEHIKVIDGKFDNVDGRLTKDEEDIEDVEDDMKLMVKEFRAMCEKLSKHDFIVSSIEPEFKDLKREFYKFKSAVDTNTKVGFTGVHTTNDNIEDPENSR